MSNPTDRYGLSFPAENVDPWYSGYADFNQQVDTTISSVEQLSRVLNRTTCVISCYLTVGVTWPASSTLPAAANSTVLSAAPLGRFTGSITVPASGMNVKFELNMPVTAYGNAATFTGTPCNIAQYFRLVDAASRNMTTDSAWHLRHSAVLLEGPPAVFLAVTSLGAGTYTVELQQRALWSTANASSMTALLSSNHINLWATIEGR